MLSTQVNLFAVVGLASLFAAPVQVIRWLWRRSRGVVAPFPYFALVVFIAFSAASVGVALGYCLQEILPPWGTAVVVCAATSVFSLPALWVVKAQFRAGVTKALSATSGATGPEST